jgi:hypothetical protein
MVVFGSKLPATWPSLCVYCIATRQRSYSLSHVYPHRIFDEVEERGREEKTGGCFTK